jgi:Ala-tRNA(Pro) deacylase
MPATPDQLFARLAELGIAATTHRHPPLFTVEESRRLRGAIPGGHCKSLFLKDKKGQLWLVVRLEDRRLDLKRLDRLIGSARLSFGQPELLEAALGVTPGAVTPFALINDRERRVRVVLDRAMLALELLNYHPLENTATTTIRSADLLRFIAACGHEPAIVDLDPVSLPAPAGAG